MVSLETVKKTERMEEEEKAQESRKEEKAVMGGSRTSDPRTGIEGGVEYFSNGEAGELGRKGRRKARIK